jgi:ABC-type dipeptide/oligopeptide/nickel transport system permease component
MGSGILLQDFTLGEFWFPTSGFKNARAGNPIPFEGGEGMFRTNFRLFDSIIHNESVLFHDTFIHYILPVLCLTLVSLATSTRITRTCMLDVLDQDYVRTARAKGCREETVINKHALRNAMIPVSGVIIGGIRGSLMGSMILEQTFNIYGLGMSFFYAITYRDYFMINGITIYLIFVIVFTNLIADIMYTIIDPRIVYT